MLRAKCRFCNKPSTAAVGDLHLCGEHLTAYFNKLDSISSDKRRSEGWLAKLTRWFGWDWRKYQQETRDTRKQAIDELDKEPK